MRKSLLYIATILIASACDVPITLDPEQTPPIPVIEGVLTNVEGKNYIKITETVDFYFEGNNPYRDDATVYVTDGQNIRIDYDHYSGSNPDSLGYYMPPPGFKGTTGQTYTLSVVLDGVSYNATEQMLPVTQIDSLSATVNVAESLDPEEEGRFWEVLLYAKEPQGTKDFYLFKFYRNNLFETAFENDIYIVDDLFLSVNIEGIPVPFFFEEGDTAVVEMYGIPNSAFIYYSDLQIALANDGGLFSPPPANPRTNFNRNTPGYWLVASLASDSIIVE